MRLNFFMDIVTAMTFSYIVYVTLEDFQKQIDEFLLNPKSKITKCLNKNNEEEQKEWKKTTIYDT